MERPLAKHTADLKLGLGLGFFRMHVHFISFEPLRHSSHYQACLYEGDEEC